MRELPFEKEPSSPSWAWFMLSAGQGWWPQRCIRADSFSQLAISFNCIVAFLTEPFQHPFRVDEGERLIFPWHWSVSLCEGERGLDGTEHCLVNLIYWTAQTAVGVGGRSPVSCSVKETKHSFALQSWILRKLWSLFHSLIRVFRLAFMVGIKLCVNFRLENIDPLNQSLSKQLLSSHQPCAEFWKYKYEQNIVLTLEELIIMW